MTLTSITCKCNGEYIKFHRKRKILTTPQKNFQKSQKHNLLCLSAKTHISSLYKINKNNPVRLSDVVIPIFVLTSLDLVSPVLHHHLTNDLNARYWLWLWLFSATGLDPVGSSTTPSAPGQSIDLLSALGLHNGTWKGVTLARGPQQLRPAYQLQGKMVKSDECDCTYARV